MYGAGVWERQAPECRPDLLELGRPFFVRDYPKSTGAWLMTVSHAGITFDTIYLRRGDDGMAEVGEIHGGAPLIAAESVARAAGSTSGNPVVEAELIFADVGCGRDGIVWRLVRRSGAAVYFVSDYPGAPPPGILFREDQIRLHSRDGRAPGAAKPLPACGCVLYRSALRVRRWP